jgi:hypothetical protein
MRFARQAFIVLSPASNKLEILLPLMPDVRAALEAVQPGQVVKITAQSGRSDPKP